jgi:hypothetical protein
MFMMIFLCKNVQILLRQRGSEIWEPAAYLFRLLVAAVTVAAVGNCVVAVAAVAVGLPSCLLVRRFRGWGILGRRVETFK